MVVKIFTVYTSSNYRIEYFVIYFALAHNLARFQAFDTLTEAVSDIPLNTNCSCQI